MPASCGEKPSLVHPSRNGAGFLNSMQVSLASRACPASPRSQGTRPTCLPVLLGIPLQAIQQAPLSLSPLVSFSCWSSAEPLYITSFLFQCSYASFLEFHRQVQRDVRDAIRGTQAQFALQYGLLEVVGLI